MLVRDAMVGNPLMVPAHMPVLDFIAQVLNCNQTTGAVVDSENSSLVGIVGVHDVFRKIIPHYVDMDSHLMNVMHTGYFEEKFERFKNTTVGEIMITEVDFVSPEDAIVKAVAILVRKRRKSLPVVENGKIIGIITRRSVLKHVTRLAT